MLLIIDNNDSFTFNLYDLFRQYRQQSIVMREEELQSHPPDMSGVSGIVLSPGPQTPTDHPVLEQILTAHKTTHPILGICLGCQALGAHFGWKVRQMKKPLHGKTSSIRHNGHESFEGVPGEFSVMHYHSLMLEPEKNSEVEVTATDENEVPMAIAHQELPLWGFQFHPESILTGNGYRLIYNWLSLVQESSRKSQNQKTFNFEI